MSTLDRAVDAAIRDENARFLADPAAVDQARLEGETYRLRMERDGILPPLHRVTTERVRGFQPPWRTVIVYQCTDGTETRLRVNWRGPAPRGAIVGNCGHLLTIGGES